eukprot:6887245-Pyramimonas_sp.AAC.1
MPHTCSNSDILEPLLEGRSGLEQHWAIVEAVEGVLELLNVPVLNTSPETVNHIIQPAERASIRLPSGPTPSTLRPCRDSKDLRGWALGYLLGSRGGLAFSLIVFSKPRANVK